MSEIQNYNLGSVQTGTPLYNYPTAVPVSQTPVNTTQSQGQITPVYQYPSASLYNPNPQTASGVNINIYNPSGSGAGTYPANTFYYPQPYFNNNVTSQPQQQVQQQSQQIPQAEEQNSQAAQPIANTPISEKTEGTKENESSKPIVELTDDYIKTLENFIRSNDATVRKSGIGQIIKRFEEDKSRYDDPALTALLNIALQDPDSSNRLLAMSPIAAGCAHGDKNTVKLLQELQKSDKLYGQEAKMATDALINTSQTKV